MKLPIRSALIAACAMALTGCAGRTVPFDVFLRGPAKSCTIDVAGRTVSMDELGAIARREATSKRSARITPDGAESSYRCIGGVIYTLQSAGFQHVTFASAPSRKR